MMDPKKKAFSISGLRRSSYRWPGRYAAFTASKIGRNMYVCNICKKVFGRKDVQLDHVIPVVPETGWEGFDSFIDRLLCDQSGYQVLCREVCHRNKTLGENANRKAIRDANKPPKIKKKKLAKE